MAEPVGIALGVLGLAGLFRAVIEVWDFVDAGRGYAEDFSYLQTRLDNQREIFVQWGRRMGFGSDHGYNGRLNDAGLKPRIEATLQHIQLLFTSSDELVKRYGITIEETEMDGIVQPYGGTLQIWKTSFDRFRTALRRKQRKTSASKILRWSIRDADKFEILVDRASELLRDLNEMTRDFVSQERDEEIANEEAESISDICQLQQVQDAISQQAGYAETLISSAASSRQRRLEQHGAGTIITNMSTLDLHDDYAVSIAGGSLDASFFTGRTHQSQTLEVGDLLDIVTAPQFESIEITQRRGIEEGASNRHIPSNQRVISLVYGSSDHPQPHFDVIADFNYGQSLTVIKEEDQVKIITACSMSIGLPRGPRAKRILAEVRNLDEHITWLSAAPIGTDFSKLLVSMEGPPGTPYEHGIFWLYLEYPPEYPFKPPKAHFITRIYHPNIDCRGYICLDIISDRWSPIYSLRTVLISITSILSDPGLGDPLIPEIAQIYIQDYNLYYENARSYTRKYATGERPDITDDNIEDYRTATRILG